MNNYININHNIYIMEANFDLDINNYTMDDLLKFFKLENNFSFEDLLKREEKIATEILSLDNIF